MFERNCLGQRCLHRQYHLIYTHAYMYIYISMYVFMCTRWQRQSKCCLRQCSGVGCFACRKSIYPQPRVFTEFLTAHCRHRCLLRPYRQEVCRSFRCRWRGVCRDVRRANNEIRYSVLSVGRSIDVRAKKGCIHACTRMYTYVCTYYLLANEYHRYCKIFLCTCMCASICLYSFTPCCTRSLKCRFRV